MISEIGESLSPKVCELCGAENPCGFKPKEIYYRLTTRHPDGCMCPICGSEYIYSWPELEDWLKMSEKEKRSFEVCSCCGYGEEDFPYEEFE